MVSVYVTRFLSLCRVMRTFALVNYFVCFTCFCSPLARLRWGFLIPLNALSLDGVFRACFAVGFSPFYIRFHLVGPFRCPFCFRPRRAKNLVLIFARKSRLILFSGAVGKEKGLALQARIPRLTWFPLLCGFIS